jgi:hypothetical protein
MTHDDLMRLALEAGAKPHPNPDCWGIFTISHDDVERFAAFIMLYEREECIAIAESKRHSPNFVLASIPSQNGTAVDIANLIRARGEK